VKVNDFSFQYFLAAINHKIVLFSLELIYICLTDNGYHPRNHIGQRADPDDAHDEGKRKNLVVLGLLAVRDGDAK